MKSTYCLVAVTIAAIAMPPVARAIDAVVTPPTSSAGLDVSGLVNLTAPGSLAGIDERTPLVEVLDRRNISLRTLLSPSSFNLTWDPVFESGSGDYTSISSEGVVAVDGVQVGVRNLPLSTFCFALNCPPVSETLVLSGALLEAVARALLNDVTLRDAQENRIGSKAGTLQYTRGWTHNGISPTDHFATFSVSLSAQPNLNVRISQFSLLDVAGVSLSPVLPIGTPASIPISLQWRTRFQVLGTPPPTTIASDAVEVRTPDGRVLQRIARRIARPVTRAKTLAEAFPSAGVETGTEVMQETLSLPASVTAAARAASASRVIIRRRFSDGFNTRTGDIVLPLGSASLAGFQLTRVDLRFTDGARATVAERGSPLRAVADINYLGSGQIEAVWEWAPLPGGGTPLFRPLPPAPPVALDAALLSDFDSRQSRTLVREFLNNQKRVKLISPPVPTTDPGGVLLRLRVSAPDVVFALPILRYYVGNAAAPPVAEASELDALRLLEPFSDGEMSRDTRFRWMPIANAKAYRLECYSDLLMTGNMVTGAIVPGEHDQLSPSRLVMEHLLDGTGYWCRMVAIGREGLPSAASDMVRLTARR